ncbi:unnamed protein product [Amoebophrya sp. A25]|nr:unnamed protein product [Amoebophrya sp. A25]|eukprot:GSA25T00018101001.1
MQLLCEAVMKRASVWLVRFSDPSMCLILAEIGLLLLWGCACANAFYLMDDGRSQEAEKSGNF